MKKQTKLVAVLSTAALLAIGASMTSFAATGWAEEDGTWVYYNRDGERATDSWKKSGNNWYYLDSDGEMAIDQLIEDGDNYYYVDINGVMASNQWVAIENEDAGEDNEPEHYWYYFQANGKALTNGDNTNIALKTINGKKYAFDDEGKMLYGWVAKDNAERIDNTDNDAFKEGDYYFGGEDDGAMTTGWLQMDVTYDEATSGTLGDFVAPAFNEDEDQTRWFYFQSNGKKVKADPSKGDTQKSKTINGKKYEFDENGAMTAEWSLDVDKVTDSNGNNPASKGNAAETVEYAKYAKEWRYFSSVEDGARVSKGWFKVVPAEMLHTGKYDDDEDFWYYADGSGNLYAGEFKTIKGKKYAFRADGRMVDGLKFIKDDATGFDVVADDDDAAHEFTNEDEFDASAPWFERNGYKCYYFGDSSDGSMRTNKTSIDIDGEKFNFYFQKSGGHKGAGVTGEKDDKYYQSGKLLKAGSDEKYQVIKADATTAAEKALGAADYTYTKYEDAEDFLSDLRTNGMLTVDASSGVIQADVDAAKAVSGVSFNKAVDDLSELYVVDYTVSGAYREADLKLVNTSGKVVEKAKSKDGNDFVYVTDRDGVVRIIYVED